MRNKLFAFSFFLLMAGQTAFTQKLIDRGSLATTSTNALSRKLDSIFSSFNKFTPGVAVTVLQNGKVLAKKAYGLACLEFCVAFPTVLLFVCLIQKEAESFWLFWTRTKPLNVL